MRYERVYFNFAIDKKDSSFVSELLFSSVDFNIGCLCHVRPIFSEEVWPMCIVHGQILFAKKVPQ